MLVKGEPKTARLGRKSSLRVMGVTNRYLFPQESDRLEKQRKPDFMSTLILDSIIDYWDLI